MPLNEDIIKVTYFGAMGSDVWNTGFNVTLDVAGGVPSQADLNAAAVIFRGFFTLRAWDTAQRALAAVWTSYLGVRLHYYPAGSQVATRVAESLIPSPFVGTSANPHPSQCSIVASLRTVSSSRRGRGRMYLPYNGIGNITGGVYNTTHIPTVGDAVANLLSDVNIMAAVGGLSNFQAVVASQADGICLPVTNVIVDNVPDVQRRRSNNLTATLRSSFAVTP